MKPDKIISGGQTGADQGGLHGARCVRIGTGGWMPRDFLTEDGPAPHIALEYGLREHPSKEYPPRTRRNVLDSDGTVWIGVADGRGFKRTKKEAEAAGKPFLENPTAVQLALWVDRHNHQDSQRRRATRKPRPGCVQARF